MQGNAGTNWSVADNLGREEQEMANASQLASFHVQIPPAQLVSEPEAQAGTLSVSLPPENLAPTEHGKCLNLWRILHKLKLVVTQTPQVGTSCGTK